MEDPVILKLQKALDAIDSMTPEEYDALCLEASKRENVQVVLDPPILDKLEEK